jgi:hypothetical protein
VTVLKFVAFADATFPRGGIIVAAAGTVYGLTATSGASPQSLLLKFLLPAAKLSRVCKSLVVFPNGLQLARNIRRTNHLMVTLCISISLLVFLSIGIWLKSFRVKWKIC